MIREKVFEMPLKASMVWYIARYGLIKFFEWTKIMCESSNLFATINVLYNDDK